ncbi:MAG: hypothetical protein Q9168_006459 [Polycauliona sp. 1 TL-2023]
MLPLALQSSYKTYKEDTNAIATWLATKARQCGYSADLWNCDESSKSSKAVQAPKRLKGKARKNAQEASKAAAAANPAVPVTVEPITYVIKVKEFISLAEYIVGSSEASVKLPLGLLRVLDRAINLRKQFGFAAGELANSDEGHAYFLGILEQTREILKPTVDGSFQKPSSENGPTEAEAQEDISNMFDILDLEEPSQEFLDAPGVEPAPPTANKEPQPEYEAEIPKTPEEELLAAHCLLADVRSIRRFLCGLWKNYQEGMDLCAVSITVNTAIGFVRDLELDVVRRFPAKSNYESLVKIFYVAQSVVRGHNPLHKEQQGDLFNLAVYDVAEDMMLPTYNTLCDLQRVIKTGTVPQYRPGFFGHRDKRTCWHEKTARDKIQDDRLAMMEAFPDLVLLSTITSRTPLAEDELMRGIRQMSPGKDIPLWLVFAAQCFLDAQHEMRDNISEGHDQLRKNANSMRTSINQNLEFHKALKIVNWPKQNDLGFTGLLYMIDQWIEKDVVADKWHNVNRQIVVPDSEPFQLLRQYPVICGLFSFALTMHYQEIQVTFVNAWGSLMYTGQLYNAVRQEKLMTRSKMWKDMEFVMSLQGYDKFFVGDPPTELEAYLKRFVLSMGGSATNFAKNRRKNTVAVSAKGPRQLTKLCAAGQLFIGRYCNNDAAVGWTTEMMKSIIEAKLKDDSEDDNDDEVEPLPRESGGGKPLNDTTKGDSVQGIKGQKTKKVKQSKSGSLLIQSYRSKSLIPTTNFLRDLAHALHAESIEMNIDYLRIHRSCWTLLRSVNEACKPRLLQAYGGGYLDREDQLPFVVGYIFMSATTTAHIAGLLLPKKTGIQVSSQLLKTAAEVIEEKMDSGAGAVEMGELERRLSTVIHFGVVL